MHTYKQASTRAVGRAGCSGGYKGVVQPSVGSSRQRRLVRPRMLSLLWLASEQLLVEFLLHNILHT